MKKARIKPKSRELVIMPIVRVTGNYQMTIPAPIRKALGVNAGDYVEVTLNKEGLAVLRPVEVVVKKTRQQDSEDQAWASFSQEQFMQGYDEKDSAYDKF